jgi:hypothetical protein
LKKISKKPQTICRDGSFQAVRDWLPVLRKNGGEAEGLGLPIFISPRLNAALMYGA